MKAIAPRVSSKASAAALVRELRAQRSDDNIEGQRRFGIRAGGEMLGISAPVLRAMAHRHRRNHGLALELWKTGIHDARILAALVEDPPQITLAQMESWVRELDNWAVTDSTAFLFDRTSFAERKAHAWSRRRAEYEKRAAFSIMAGMAVHRKELADEIFLAFLPVITREATDERNFVRKAVNWALRQIGKRNPRLRRAAIAEARRIARLDSRAARWIAADALRELTRYRGRIRNARRPSPPRVARRRPTPMRRETPG